MNKYSSILDNISNEFKLNLNERFMQSDLSFERFYAFQQLFYKFGNQ